MKKALTFLLIFSLLFYPQRQSTAQSDSAVTKSDIQNLNKKDSAVTVKISKQIETVNKQIDAIGDRKPERIVRYRTRIKNHIRTDSFYVYIDTCLGRSETIQTISDTVWMERNKPKFNEFFKNIFGHKQRKDELKVVEPDKK